MTDTTIEDIYRRLNALTEDVNNLKIQAGTIGSTQVAVAQNLNLLIALTAEMREFKTNTNADLSLLKADVSELKTNVNEILRILRDRNGGSGL